MALTFTASSNDRVGCGSAASLDDLSSMTILAVVMPTSLVTNCGIVGKRNLASGTGWGFQLTGTGGNLRFTSGGGSGSEVYDTNDTPLSGTGQWYRVALTRNKAGTSGARVAMRTGGLTGALTARTLGTTIDPTTYGSDAAQNLAIGNRFDDASAVTAWPGSIAFVAIFPSILTLAQMEIQFRRLYAPIVSAAGLWHLGLQHGTSAQMDLSGNGNHGTVTGATAAVHAPIRMRRPIIVLPPAIGGGPATLSVADAAHGHTADSPALTQANELAVDSATHGHAAEAPALVQQSTLAPADALHGHSADAPALTQQNVLAPADALHGHAADGVTLQSGDTLAVAEALHAHAAEAPALVQANVLAVAEAAHAHAAESPTLAAGFLLAVAEALHGHAAESPTLSTATLLAVTDSLHAHLADGVPLTQANILAVADALHLHYADVAGLIDEGQQPSFTATPGARTLTATPGARSLVGTPIRRA